MSHTVVHGVELLTDRDRIAAVIDGSDVFASTRQGPADFEPETLAAFKQAVMERPGCVIDVGAYTGLFTLLALQAGAAEVVALEPNPAGYRRLLENLDGRYPNVRTIRAAASNRHGRAFLAIDSEHLGICSTGKVTDTGGQPVRLLTIDNLERTLPVTVIKLDVEGHELLALQGAEDTLKADHPALFVEVNSRNGGDRKRRIVEYLAELGYKGTPLDDRNMVFRP